jgi:hypothetical protein
MFSSAMVQAYGQDGNSGFVNPNLALDPSRSRHNSSESIVACGNQHVLQDPAGPESLMVRPDVFPR